MSKGIKLGTENQKPGQYIEVGPRGGKVNNAGVININEGDRLPPTQQRGNNWIPKQGRPRR